MPLISQVIDNANALRTLLGKPTNSTWTQRTANALIPVDNATGISLEYSGMTGTIEVKQADVVLKIYPLSWTTNYTNSNAQSDYAYYATKQSQEGPAMTYSIFAIIANQVNDYGCSAYTYQQYSSYPYVRAPWFQLSEQMNDNYALNGNYHPALPFMTGHGGAYQVALFGYLGLRMINDGTLHIAPSLPPQIPQIRYRTFYYQDWPIAATSSQESTTLTRAHAPLANANKTFANSPIPVVVGRVGEATESYNLRLGESITVPNRIIANQSAVAGNVLQCAALYDTTAGFELGQFPIGAIDGDTTTTWQPNTTDAASITVQVPSQFVELKLNSIYINWGDIPAASFSVSGGNTTTWELNSETEIATSIPVEVDGYVITNSSVALSPGYSTTYVPTLQFFVPQYVTLTIRGNLNGSTTSATVAEWSISAS